MYWGVANFMKGFLSYQSVPIYFFISGYVFFLGVTLTKEKYAQKLKNRVKTLLIPYIIWNVLVLLQYIVLRLPAFANWELAIQQVELNPTLSGFLNCFWNVNHSVFPLPLYNNVASLFPINEPLWFLRELMIVVLTAPAIYWLLKKTKFYLLIPLGLLKFMAPICDWGYVSQLLTAYFFFSWGAYMSIWGKDMLVEFGRYARLSVVFYFLLGFLYIILMRYCPDAALFVKQINIFVGLLFAYNLAAWCLRRGIFKPHAFLASASFFIYVSHKLLWVLLQKMLLFVLKPSSAITVLSTYAATWFLCIALLLVTFWFLRQYTPSVLKVIAGRK